MYVHHVIGALQMHWTMMVVMVVCETVCDADLRKLIYFWHCINN